MRRIILALVCGLLLSGCGGGSDDGNGTPTPLPEFEADADTIALWHFNEGSGQTAADSTGHGYDLQLGSTTGTDTDDPSWTSLGRFGNALVFRAADNTQAFNTIGHPFPGNQASVELWYRTTGREGFLFEAGSTTCTVGWDNGGALFFFAVGDGFNWTRCEVTDTAVLDLIADGEWHYIAATFDGTTERVYVDAVERQNRVVSITMASAGGHIAGMHGPTMPLEGVLDEIRLSSIARTESEIQGHYADATAP